MVSMSVVISVSDSDDLARALRFFMRACGASFGEARLQFSQFYMRDTLSYIFDSLIMPF